MKISKTNQIIINKNLREYFKLGTKINNLDNINRNASLEHELKINEIATKLIYEGRAVVVGGTLKNGQKPDLTAIDLIAPIIYEIGVTEKFLRETKEYPFRVKFIKTRR